MAVEIKGTFKEFWSNNYPVNIWDDYYNDDYVPEGEKQETHAYVEDYEMPDEEKEAVMQVVYNHLKTLDLPGVELEFSQDVYFTHLTHKRREKLVEELDTAGLKYNNKPIRFYSES